MSLDYKTRKYEPNEEKRIVELLDDIFKGWPHFDIDRSPLDHWIWKYRDNPQDKGWASVAEADGKIVGCYHLFFTRIKVGPEVILSMQSADAGVLPDFQGQGIFKKLYSDIDKFWDTKKPKDT
jgi:GNAT superfamily N-acetyltransferase